MRFIENVVAGKFCGICCSPNHCPRFVCEPFGAANKPGPSRNFAPSKEFLSRHLQSLSAVSYALFTFICTGHKGAPRAKGNLLFRSARGKSLLDEFRALTLPIKVTAQRSLAGVERLSSAQSVCDFTQAHRSLRTGGRSAPGIPR